MATLPLPPAHTAQLNSSNPVVFFDFIINNPSTATSTPQRRVVIELKTKSIGPKITNYVKHFFLGDIQQDSLPYGLYRQSATRLIQNQSVVFTLVAEAANCSPGTLQDIESCLSKIIIDPSSSSSQQQLTIPRYSIVLSLSKLKLGNNFEMRIIHGSNPPKISADELVVGTIIEGMSGLADWDLIPVDNTLSEPLHPIRIVECGEL